jgi:hypothetical protein
LATCVSFPSGRLRQDHGRISENGGPRWLFLDLADGEYLQSTSPILAVQGSRPVWTADVGTRYGCYGGPFIEPDAIADWAAEFRSRSLGPFQLNLWIAQQAPMRDFAAEQRVRKFLSSWGSTVPAEASGIQFPDFEKQCDSFVAIRPSVVSSIMGLYPSPFVAKLKDQGIA